MIDIGILGTGSTASVAAWHTGAILESKRARVAAVYNRTPEGMARWAERFSSDARRCASLEELLDHCDAVIICTPNHTHFEYARAALLAGKHVLLEKPMTLTPQEAVQLEELAGRSPGFSTVGYVYRFSAAVGRLRSLVRDCIGPVYTISGSLGGTRLADPNIGIEWRMKAERSGSGALHDFGGHLLDTAHFVTGEPFSAISCMRRVFVPERQGPQGPEPVETDDAAVLCCRGERSLGSFSVSRVGGDPLALHLAGEGGMAQLHMGPIPQLLFWEKPRDGAYAGGYRSVELPAERPFADWFRGELEDFLDGIEGGASLGATVSDGRYVDELLDAALHSAR